jgi:hypothetical protein
MHSFIFDRLPFNVAMQREVAMEFYKDKKKLQCVRWKIGKNAWKMAWIQDRSGEPEKDWAGTGRYLNVVRAVGEKTGPVGNATDFPIAKEMQHVSDIQILTSFVLAISTMTGRPVDISNLTAL